MRMALLTAREPRKDGHMNILFIFCAYLYPVCTVEDDKFECVACGRPVGRDKVFVNCCSGEGISRRDVHLGSKCRMGSSSRDERGKP